MRKFRSEYKKLLRTGRIYWDKDVDFAKIIVVDFVNHPENHTSPHIAKLFNLMNKHPNCQLLNWCSVEYETGTPHQIQYCPITEEWLGYVANGKNHYVTRCATKVITRD
jgi:hypothetical protein